MDNENTPANSAFSAYKKRFEAQCHILDGKPKVSYYEDVLYVPAQRGTKQGTPYTGGLIDSTGTQVPEATLWRGNNSVNAGGRTPRRKPREWPGVALYLGWLFPAYGHAVVESLARCWALDEGLTYDQVLFHSPMQSEPPGYLRYWLKALGINETPTFDVPTRIKAVYVPEPAFEVKKRAFRILNSTFAKIRGSSSPNSLSSMPVYVSRSLLSSNKRTSPGELLLERI